MTLGFSKRYVRCLQISEVVNSMKDLIDFCRENKVGPIERLKVYPRHANATKLQMQKIQEMEQLASIQGMPTDRNTLWMKSSEGGSETLNVALYRTFSCISTRQSGLVTDASRDSCMVIINSLALVETMMDANRWTDMFPTLVARASTIGMISSCPNRTSNDACRASNAFAIGSSPSTEVPPLFQAACRGCVGCRRRFR